MCVCVCVCGNGPTVFPMPGPGSEQREPGDVASNYAEVLADGVWCSTAGFQTQSLVIVSHLVASMIMFLKLSQMLLTPVTSE